MNHIELFAGCGGLSLGLSHAGFDLTMANELSPMASETFAYNFFGEDLLDAPQSCSRTVWVSSNFPRSEMKSRLREDPRTYPAEGVSDLKSDGSNLGNSLVVGSILDLNRWLEANPEALAKLRDGFGDGGIDLVSGGPPCQSFSLAGLREKNNEKNSLPWAFAHFVDLVRPKTVLLENVTGNLRPFTENGMKYHAWFEVAKAFAMIGYVPLALHINAKYAGVAQNRPRFILMGFRKDVFERLRPSFNEAERTLFASSERFFGLVSEETSRNNATLEDLAVHDLNKEEDATWNMFHSSFLCPLAVRRDSFVTVRDAIGDLELSGRHRISEYVRELNRTFNPYLKMVGRGDFSNKIIESQPRVRRRFRLYQVMGKGTVSNDVRRALSAFIAGKSDELPQGVWNAVSHEKFLLENETMGVFPDKSSFEAYLREHRTKKQTQRALLGDQPAPAALSIPDDACHYTDLRTLSAREMARIQSFPDGFIFRSKMTTGGSSRKFEVPVYTQIGNAVPVILGAALGEAMRSILKRL